MEYQIVCRYNTLVESGEWLAALFKDFTREYEGLYLEDVSKLPGISVGQIWEPTSGQRFCVLSVKDNYVIVGWLGDGDIGYYSLEDFNNFKLLSNGA